MDIYELVFRTVKEIAGEESIPVENLSLSTALVDEIGFASLQIARLLAKLDSEIGYDPFSTGRASITDIRTVGDLCTAFERAA